MTHDSSIADWTHTILIEKLLLPVWTESMVTHMKTTVDIADPILESAKRAAAERGVTLRSLIEEGLERVLSETLPPGKFRLRDASIEGLGATNWHELSNDERTAAMYSL